MEQLDSAILQRPEVQKAIARNQEVLKRYLPEAVVQIMAHWIVQYNFKLKIKKSRSTKLGDYRAPFQGLGHQITINHDLNSYAFFITLVHEVAHLVTWEKHKNKVKPHGEEWKQAFKTLMWPFIQAAVFPEDVAKALVRYMADPAASSCTDTHLQRVLKRYDSSNTHFVLLETLAQGTPFLYNQRLFIKGVQRRKNYFCREAATGKDYLFNPISEVIPYSQSREEVAGVAERTQGIQEVIPQASPEAHSYLAHQLPQGQVFFFNKRRFIMVEKKRTRVVCKEPESGKLFSLSGLAKVEICLDSDSGNSVGQGRLF